MKKNILLLVIGVLVILPFSVRAYAIDISSDEATSKTKCVTIQCDNGSGNCVNQCEIYIKDNTEGITDPINIVLKPKYTELVISDIVAADGFTFSGTASSAVFTPSSPLGVTDTSFKLASYKVTYPKGVDCSIDIGFTTEEVVPVPTPTTPSQPNTGVSLPVVILASALGLAVISYSVTNKNKKMYKI